MPTRLTSSLVVEIASSHLWGWKLSGSFVSFDWWTTGWVLPSFVLGYFSHVMHRKESTESTNCSLSLAEFI